MGNLIPYNQMEKTAQEIINESKYSSEDLVDLNITRCLNETKNY